MTRLVAPSQLQHDPVNPRERDAARFGLVALSLRKFGFLLPLYARADGLVLSGHQRSDAAGAMGWEVPVRYLGSAVRDVAGLNLTFNRATNDFSLQDVRHDRFDIEEIAAMLGALPDATDRFPCMETVMMKVDGLVRLNADLFNRYSLNAARQLAEHGVTMPIVVGDDGTVLNGIGRLMYASEAGNDLVEVVTVPAALASAIRAAMNALSMDFRLNDGFKDVLRRNAFRRARQRRRTLGSGYL